MFLKSILLFLKISIIMSATIRPYNCILIVLIYVFIKAVNEALSVGASLLLPPLPERMEVLHSLLPQAPDSWDSLTVGEVNLIWLYVL